MTEQRGEHIGSSFDDFLEEEGIKTEVEAAALKRVIAWQLNILGTLEKISRATKEHDEGKGILVDEFFHGFEKKHGLRRNSAKR